MIIEIAHNALHDAGYFVTRRSDAFDTILFEDTAILGLLVVYPTAENIASEWRNTQDAFLREYALELRRSPEKAWNTYLVLLTAEQPTPVTRRRLSVVEEDFSGMRKIAAAGVLSSADVSHALAPLLPLKSVTLQNESFTDRIRKAVAWDEDTFAALASGDVQQLLTAVLEDRK